MTGLYLKIESEPYEIKCGTCQFWETTGKESFELSPEEVKEGVESCSICHGTGTRQVKLTGMVEVKVRDDRVCTADYVSGNYIPSHIVRLLEEEDDKDYSEAFEELHNNIIEAYLLRDGTLPDEIRSQLTEEPA